MNLTDSHCHLQDPKFSRDMPQVIERARASGATVILNAAPARPLENLAGLIDVLVVNAASAALTISDAPFEGPIGCVRVGTAAHVEPRSRPDRHRHHSLRAWSIH